MNASPAPFDPGLRFIVEPSSTRLTPLEKQQLADLRPAGIMLRKRNFSQTEQYPVWLGELGALLEEVRESIGRPNIIVSIDHEGGAVHRLPPPLTRFPYAATYGASVEAVKAVSAIMAHELASIGVNVSYSPVADIHSNPKNPVINERAYGTTAEQVARAAVACAQSLRAHGIVPCAKHFPGHGDTAVDSHWMLPIVAHTKGELLSRELVPFKALVDDGIEIVMSAHLIAIGLDADRQATISPVVLTELLRDELGFKGVTIADALGMKGIFDVIMSGSFTAQAHEAGLDLFLMAGDAVMLKDALRLRDELLRGLDQGRLPLDSLQRSQARIELLLGTLPQYPVRELGASDLKRHAALAETLAKNAAWSSFIFNPQGFE
jgi:beta-N-acetylhexosaminidase